MTGENAITLTFKREPIHMEQKIDNRNELEALNRSLEEAQKREITGDAKLPAWDRYLVILGMSKYDPKVSPKEISLDPKNHGFTVTLMECCDLERRHKFKVPSLVKYLSPSTGKILFYLYGLSDKQEGILTLLDALPQLNEIDFEKTPCLMLSFEKNSEIHREILKKKAHTPYSNRIVAASLFLNTIGRKHTDDLSFLIETEGDQTALLLAVSNALKDPQNYDIDWLATAITINNIDAAIRFAIAQRDLLLFDFLEEKCGPIVLDADQKQKVDWLRRINILQQQVKESFLPEPLARYIWYKKQSQQLRHEQKEFIKNKGPLASVINPLHPHSPIAAILAGTYYESNDREKRKVLAQSIADQLTPYSDYQKTPLMAPLVYLLALNMLMGPGGPILTSKIRKHRPLKIIMTTDAKITGLSPHILSDEHSAAGEYSVNKNNLFLAFDESKNIKEVIRSLLHEAAHLAANEVYQHSALPYRKGDFARKKRYQLVEKNIRSQIDHWVPHNQKEWMVIDRFRKVFFYRDKQINGELFVRVPEVISILGYEQGVAWLKQYVPDLLKLYEEEFLPDCLHYLKYRQMNAYFSLDSSFSAALQSTNLPEPSLVLNNDEVKMLVLSFAVLVCGIILAAANPITFIAGLIFVAVAFIPPLAIAIKFYQTTASRLAAMELEPPPINYPPEAVHQSNFNPSVKSSVFSQSNPQPVLPTNNPKDNNKLKI